MTDEEKELEKRTKYMTERGKRIYKNIYYLIKENNELKAQSKWHKVSEGRIPTEEKDYLVKLTDGTIDVMRIALDGDLEPYLLTPKFDFYKDVEKWCEIPKEIKENDL